MVIRFFALILLILLILPIVACTPETTKLQYMPDMADTPTVKAQEDYLDPPVGSVARGALFYAPTADASTAKGDVPFNAEQGKHLYETFCSACHGDGGKGDGPVSEDFPKPPDLTLPLYRQRSDSFIFHRITFGTAIMPAYGHMTDPAERWQITYHLRTLQRESRQ